MKKAAKKISLLILLVGLVLLASQFTVMLRRIGIRGGVTSLIGTIHDPAARFPDKDRVNILLIGKDYNRDQRGMPFTKGARSDTLVMISIDLQSRQVSALSIPRDVYVEAPDGHSGKINGAYARGGADLAVRTVGGLLGVMPDYHVALKADAVKTVVDALGGVEVEARDRMKYDDNWGQLHIDLPAGPQVIDGEQAIGFTRYRKPNPGEPPSKEDGDERRMARQQMLIRAAAQKAKQRFTDPRNWPAADDFILTALQVIETDLTRDQIFALGALLRGFKPEQMQTASLAATDFRSGGTWYLRPDPEKVEAQVAWLLKGDEAAARRLTMVAVKNGTSVRGAARVVRERLRAEGFGILETREAWSHRSVTETRVFYTKAMHFPNAQAVASVIGGGKLTKQEMTSGPDILVVLGSDLASQ